MSDIDSNWLNEVENEYFSVLLEGVIMPTFVFNYNREIITGDSEFYCVGCNEKAVIGRLHIHNTHPRLYCYFYVNDDYEKEMMLQFIFDFYRKYICSYVPGYQKNKTFELSIYYNTSVIIYEFVDEEFIKLIYALRVGENCLEETINIKNPKWREIKYNLNLDNVDVVEIEKFNKANDKKLKKLVKEYFDYTFNDNEKFKLFKKYVAVYEASILDIPLIKKANDLYRYMRY